MNIPHSTKPQACTRTIDELLAEKFVVAEYQRGYKWTTEEVRHLLNDVQDFDLKKNGSFYCLQPIVVSRRRLSDEWELIDGQQRVTTIYLILSHLAHQPYSIRYLTREGSKAFLDRMSDPAFAVGLDRNTYFAQHPDHNNIDNYHFFAARDAIVSWFQETKKEQPDVRAAFLQKLRSEVRVIWYEVDDPDHKKIFLNLNSGKIALTNAERIKALFLNAKASTAAPEEARFKQVEIAQEWDRIEYALRDEAFWLFLNQKVQGQDQDTRIDYVFRLLSRMEPPTAPGRRIKPGDEFTTYEHYSRLAQEHQLDIAAEWTRVKACFQTLQEWFENRELYHNIGFLITIGIGVGELYAEACDVSRTVFKTWVAERIRKHFKNCNLDDLDYNENRQRISNVLLLFNVRALKSEHARFPFDLYKKEDWSLEHIHAQKSRKLLADDEWNDWVAWVRPQLESLPPDQSAELWEALDIPLDPDGTEAEKNRRIEDIKSLAAKVLPELQEDKLHQLGNLALLSRELNSSLNNSDFDEKRTLLINHDKDGRFIPIATKNVFLKYYGGDTKFMKRWTTDDRSAYLAEIKKTLAADLSPV